MQCDGQPHVCGPFNGEKFIHDFARELRRLAAGKGPPAYPEKTWHRALAIADERDRLRFASELNAANDAIYFQTQHVSCIAASLLHEFNASCVHRTSSGAIRIAPEIHEFKTPEDGRHTRWQNERGQVERAKITARATGNRQHAS